MTRTIYDHRSFLERQPDSYFRPEGLRSVVVIADGDRLNRARAQGVLAANPHAYSLGDTGAGPYVANAREELGPGEGLELLGLAETRFAAAAHGSAQTYVAGSAENFQKYGVHTLLANEKVTDVNGVPRDVLAAFPQERQFAMVWASELLRDQREHALSPERRPMTSDEVEHGPAPVLRPVSQAPKPPLEVRKALDDLETRLGEIERDERLREQRSRGRDLDRSR